MTPEQLAAIHALCFADAPRPWSADEFREVLSAKGVTLLTGSKGFALIRQAGPEVELLTLAVAPECRRRGIGRALVFEMEEFACKHGATELFLEVSQANENARRLYENMGFKPSGYRKDYYRTADGKRVSANVLRKEVTNPA